MQLVSEYVEGVLYHETGRRHDRAELERTYRYLVATTARLLNVSAVSNELGAKRETIQARLATLEASFLLNVLPGHRSGEHRSLTAHPKIHAVDAVLTGDDGRSVAIEVKAGADVRPDDLRGLHAFLADEPDAVRGVVFYSGEQILRLDDRIWALPISALWEPPRAAPKDRARPSS